MNSEQILGVIVGLIILGVGWVAKTLFHSRQLYVVSENLYGNSLLTDKGIICEISIFNRGRQVEEDIEITLDNNLKYELLAYNDANAVLEKNIIKINRLHKKSKLGVLLLVEEGDFTFKKINKVESKSEKGRIVEKLDQVPANYIDGILGFIIFMILIVLGGAGGYFYKELMQELQVESVFNKKEEYILLEKIGWSGLEKYFKSNLSKSYYGSEFPIRFIKRKLNNENFVYVFEIYNKTTFPMGVSVNVADRKFIDEVELKSRTYNNIDDIPPLSKAILETGEIPREMFKTLEFRVSTKGTSFDTSDYIYDLNYNIE